MPNQQQIHSTTVSTTKKPAIETITTSSSEQVMNDGNLTNTHTTSEGDISAVVERILSDSDDNLDSRAEYDGSELFDNELAIAAGDFRADSGRGTRSVKKDNERSKSANARATNAQMYFNRWPERAMKKAEKLAEEGKTSGRKRAGHVVCAKPSSL